VVNRSLREREEMGFLLAVGALQIWDAVTGYHPYARERKPVTPQMPDRVSRSSQQIR